MVKKSKYRQRVAATLAKLKPTPLEAAVTASQRVAAGMRVQAEPPSEADQEGHQRVLSQNVGRPRGRRSAVLG